MRRLKKVFVPWYIGFIATILPAAIAIEVLFSKHRRSIPYLSRLGHAYFSVAHSLTGIPRVPSKPSAQAISK